MEAANLDKVAQERPSTRYVLLPWGEQILFQSRPMGEMVTSGQLMLPSMTQFDKAADVKDKNSKASRSVIKPSIHIDESIVAPASYPTEELREGSFDLSNASPYYKKRAGIALELRDHIQRSGDKFSFSPEFAKWLSANKVVWEHLLGLDLNRANYLAEGLYQLAFHWRRYEKLGPVQDVLIGRDLGPGRTWDTNFEGNKLVPVRNRMAKNYIEVGMFDHTRHSGGRPTILFCLSGDLIAALLKYVNATRPIDVAESVDDQKRAKTLISELARHINVQCGFRKLSRGRTRRTDYEAVAYRKDHLKIPMGQLVGEFCGASHTAHKHSRACLDAVKKMARDYYANLRTDFGSTV